MRNRLACVVVFLAFVMFSAGCAGVNYDGVDVESATNDFEIVKIGVCGPLSAEASNEFMYAGYLVEDLGRDIVTTMDASDGRTFTFMAIVGTVAYGTPDPFGLSSYAMRVVDLKTGETLWTSEGVYQNTATLTREDRPVSEVFREMIADFAKSYPPARTPKPDV